MLEVCVNCKYFVLSNSGRYGYCTIDIPANTLYSELVSKYYRCDVWVGKGKGGKHD